MAGISLANKTGSTGETASDSLSGNDSPSDYLLINKIASFLMANSSRDSTVVEQKNSNYNLAKLSTTKEKKNSINVPQSYGSKTPRNVSSAYKPAYVSNSVFVKTRGVSLKERSVGRSAQKINTPTNTSASIACSTVILDVNSKAVVFEENLNNWSSKSQKQNDQDSERTFPPLLQRIENTSTPPYENTRARPLTARERQRHLSGQSKGSSSKAERSAVRRSSLDYSSTAALARRDLRPSAVMASRYSQQPQDKLKIALPRRSSEPMFKVSSVRASTSSGRRQSSNFLQRPSNVPLSTLDVIDGNSNKSSNLSNVVDVSPRKLNSRHSLRSASVYSPSSAASAERLSKFRQKFGSRRASLPNPTLSYQNDSNSPEYYRTMQELKQGSNPAPQKTSGDSSRRLSLPRPSASISSSLKESQPREVLQKIEEISPEEATLTPGLDIGQKETDNDVTNAVAPPVDENHLNTDKSKKEVISNSPLSPINGLTRAFKPVVSTSSPVATDNRKQALILSNSREKKNKIVNREEDSKSKNLFEINSDPLEDFKSIWVDCDYDSDFVDDSVIFKDDDDLCDDDLHEKRMIMWIKSVSTGREAEQTTRITPPPSPDPNTMESAIRVVYDG